MDSQVLEASLEDRSEGVEDSDLNSRGTRSSHRIGGSSKSNIVPLENYAAVGASESQRVRNLARGERGRFIAVGRNMVMKVRGAEQQRRHIKKKRELKERIFGEYLGCSFLRGKDGHSILASRANRPFVVMFETCVKPDYRLGANKRHAEVRKFFLSGCHLRNAEDTISNLPVKLLRYTVCRLHLRRSICEMRRVQNWLDLLKEENALNLESVESAYERCVEILRQAEAGKDDIHLVPPTTVQASPGEEHYCGRCSQVILEDTRGNQAQFQRITNTDSGESNVVVSDFGGREVSDGHNVETMNSGDINPGPNGFTDVLNDSDDSGNWLCDDRFNRMKAVLDVAMNDEKYTMLHLALQDGADWEFGMFAGFCLEEWRKKGQEPCNLVKKVLAYVKGKRLGSVSCGELEDLERRLKATADLLDEARTVLSTTEKPLPVFGSMSWQFEG